METITVQDALHWAKKSNTDDVSELLILADAMEELGYPNADTFRDAVNRLAEAERTGMSRSPSYGGVFWEVRQRVIRLQTEIEHWLARKLHGVEWSGPFQK